jgi:hypothetical protein
VRRVVDRTRWTLPGHHPTEVTAITARAAPAKNRYAKRSSSNRLLVSRTAPLRAAQFNPHSPSKLPVLCAGFRGAV